MKITALRLTRFALLSAKCVCPLYPWVVFGSVTIPVQQDYGAPRGGPDNCTHVLRLEQPALMQPI